VNRVAGVRSVQLKGLSHSESNQRTRSSTKKLKRMLL
jgi:hypothetical protein